MKEKNSYELQKALNTQNKNLQYLVTIFSLKVQYTIKSLSFSGTILRFYLINKN